MKKTNLHWYILAALLLAGGGTVVYTQTRGLRNNNPGNIKWNAANDWVGQTGKDSAGFAIFSDAKYGVRAMGKVIDSYQRRGVKTVAQIITTWAPSSENNTRAYIKAITSATGWAEGKIPDRTAGEFLPLVKAIIRFENGLNPYSDSNLKNWLAIA